MSGKQTRTPKMLTAPEYLAALFEPEDNIAILVRNRGTARTTQRISTRERAASLAFQQWLAAENARGSDIYVGMNPIKSGACSRTKENISEIRHVYLDLDRDGDETLKAIRKSLVVPSPNFILSTSPGKHQVVWKVAGFTQDSAEALLRALAKQFDGDPAATDSTRVLRLPGFRNRKLFDEYVVQATHESTAIYCARDFSLPDDSPEALRQLGGNSYCRSLPTGHRSQSERDWAYAKRALARGENPQDIMRRIADYRSNDKPDPNYYAQHTVQRAQLDHSREATEPQPADTSPKDISIRRD